MISQLISSAVQLALVLTIVGALWFVFARSKASFASWIGLTSPPRHALLMALAATLALTMVKVPLLAWPLWLESVRGGGSVMGGLKEMGLSTETVVILVVIAVIKTALTEEIFFRGLIAKRLFAWLGFTKGNVAQALIFGAVHLGLFAVPNGPPWSLGLALAFVLFPAVTGWLIGYLNERVGGGSIAPGWAMHAAGNTLWYTAIVFLV